MLKKNKIDIDKLANRLQVYSGVMLLFGSIELSVVSGIILTQECTLNHCEHVCLMTKIFGVKHQIKQIEKQNNEYELIYGDYDYNENFQYNDGELKLYNKLTGKIKILKIK